MDTTVLTYYFFLVLALLGGGSLLILSDYQYRMALVNHVFHMILGGMFLVYGVLGLIGVVFYHEMVPPLSPLALIVGPIAIGYLVGEGCSLTVYFFFDTRRRQKDYSEPSIFPRRCK